VKRLRGLVQRERRNVRVWSREREEVLGLGFQIQKKKKLKVSFKKKNPIFK